MRRLLLMILAVLAAGPAITLPEDVPASYAPWTPVDLDAAPNFVSRWKVRAFTLDDSACRTALSQSSARVTFMADRNHSRLCHIRNRVELTGLSKARMNPVQTQCAIAARLYLWERHELQPAARAKLGRAIARIKHFSSFSCRPIRTSAGTGTRMSQHATANAIDISGFTLSDGSNLSLKSGWNGSTENASFLRAARNGLCVWFNTVLSPDYNALHADHFHADMGRWLSCR